MTLNTTSDKPISVGEVLILTAPALILGFAIRSILLAQIPEGFLVADSSSYFEFSDRLFNEGIFDLSEKRRWLYPIFLAFTKSAPAEPWKTVPIIQHLFGLATIFGIGWCTAQLVIFPRFVVPPVTILASVWPRTLWYEHVLNADSMLLSAFVGVIALLLTPKVVQKRYGLIALMLAFAFLAGMKGAGRFLWAGSIIGLFSLHGNPTRWLWSKTAIFLASISLFFVATIGKNSQGDWLALSSTLPLVRTEGEPFPHYRQLLQQQILEARSYGENYPWEVKTFKKRLNRKDPSVIAQEWVNLFRSNKQFSKVARSFWTEAIVQNPVKYSGMTATTIGIAASKSFSQPLFEPTNFWRKQRKVASSWIERDNFLKTRFGINLNAFSNKLDLDRLPSNRKSFGLFNTSEWLDRRFRWLGREPKTNSKNKLHSKYPNIYLKPLGILAIAGALISTALKTKRRQRIALLTPLLIYLIGTYAIGDAMPRYLVPVDWVGMLFAGISLDTTILVLSQFARRAKIFQGELHPKADL